jgi:FkbM family methyltransferase
MIRFVKNAVEHTPLASMYRLARDEWRFSHQRSAKTPLGYEFFGPFGMQAGTFELDEAAVIQHYLASADVFVDIGANVGYFTCIACSMKKHVVAIEPLGNNLRYLYANLQANGWGDDVEVYPVGLAGEPGLASLYGGGTAASLVPGWAGASQAFRRTIPLSTLDILLGDRFRGKRIVIKMDVEGAEYAALRGASSILRSVPRPVWLVEITLSEHRGAPNPHFMDTFELFWSLGYRAMTPDRQEKEISRAEIEAYVAGGVPRDWTAGNYLFTVARD